jgi:hypothetical protein
VGERSEEAQQQAGLKNQEGGTGTLEASSRGVHTQSLVFHICLLGSQRKKQTRTPDKRHWG